MNIQRVLHGFEMYLQNIFPNQNLAILDFQNPSDPEKYLRTRVIGACEIYIQLGFNQYHMSRSTVFMNLNLTKQRFLKTHAQLKALDSDSEDIYMQSKFEVYLQRNKNCMI